MSCDDRCEEAACYGCYMQGQRETIARVVAFLRREVGDEGPWSPEGNAVKWYADRIERGAWKEDGDG